MKHSCDLNNPYSNSWKCTILWHILEFPVHYIVLGFHHISWRIIFLKKKTRKSEILTMNLMSTSLQSIEKINCE
jgi:hypothetical protein